MIRLVRRLGALMVTAARLGPAAALRRGVGLARRAAHRLRQRLALRLRGDPAGEARARRRWGLDEAEAGDRPGKRLFRHPGSVLPVEWPASWSSSPEPRGGEPSPGPPALPPELLDAVAARARAALEHRFDLLGSGSVRVDHELEARGVEGHRYRMAPGPEEARRRLERMRELHPGVSPGYEPIDWHVDFKSGYRWDPGLWFADVRYGHRPGVDVKVPWELSRFQHAGALGLARRLLPETEEGRRAPAEFRDQVVDWIAGNPTGRGVNWACPMDVALRAVSWLTGIALLDGAGDLDAAFRWLVARSLDAHALHVAANLEHDPDTSGNHYLADVVGLLCIGAALPEAPEADRRVRWALQELISEMDRQVLADGCHSEVSTAYHRLVLELFLLGTCVGVRLPGVRRRGVGRVAAGPFGRPGAPPIRPLERAGIEPGREALFPPRYLDRLCRMAEAWEELLDGDGAFPQIGDHDSGRAYRLEPQPAPDAVGTDDPLRGAALSGVADRLFRGAIRGCDGGDDDSAPSSAGDRVPGRLPGALDGALLLPGGPPAGLAEAVEGCRVEGSRPGAGPGPMRYREDGAEVVLFPQGGIALLRRDLLRLVVPLATVPEVNTGNHAHNDLLSFVLSWDGVDFVVDGGSYLYTPAPALRNAFRSTRAHSTVAVEGREQRRWPPVEASLFLVDRDAGVGVVEADARRLVVECRYADVVHRRSFSWPAGRLLVEDAVEAPAPSALVLNLAPGVEVEGGGSVDGDGARALVLRRGERRERRVHLRISGTGEPEIRRGFYSRGYGERVENARLVAPITGAGAGVEFRFGNARGTDPYGGRGAPGAGRSGGAGGPDGEGDVDAGAGSGAAGGGGSGG